MARTKLCDELPIGFFFKLVIDISPFFQVIQGIVKRAEKNPDIGWFLDRVFKLNGLIFGRRNDRKNNHYNIYMDFLETPQAKKAAAAAKAKACAEFQKPFPNADIKQFNQTNNPYDISSYHSICAEFGVEPTTDFARCKPWAWECFHSCFQIWPSIHRHGLSKLARQVFRRRGQANQGHLVAFQQPFRKDGNKTSQFDYFVPDKANGLTPPGLSCLNQSIEAFVYCNIGAQVNVRSSILGDGGRAKEAQSEFLVLLEDAIRQQYLAKSVQRYQLAVNQ